MAVRIETLGRNRSMLGGTSNEQEIVVVAQCEIGSAF
jgi:hypothetical protein